MTISRRLLRTTTRGSAQHVEPGAFDAHVRTLAHAGAVAGNAIENRMIAETYAIHVRMDDGRTLIFNRNSLGAGVREGAYVRVEGTGFDVLR